MQLSNMKKIADLKTTESLPANIGGIVFFREEITSFSIIQ